MANAEISRFLRELETVLSTLDIERRLFESDFQGAKYFAEAQTDLFRLLCTVASPEAIAAIDKVSKNAFWFLIAAGTTMALAADVPASAEDVSRAICLQRRLIARAPGAEALLARVSSGNFNNLSEKDLGEARRRYFILLNECGIEGPTWFFNPLYL